MPAGIARDAVRVKDALDRLGIVAVRGVFNEVSVLGGFGAVSSILVVLVVVGCVVGVVPGDR